MAYFRPSIDAEGIHVPAYEDIVSYLMDRYREIFGADVYLGVDSKDYQMLSVFAKSIDDFAALSVDAYNARSPLYATGDSLDVLASVVGITRLPSESGSVVLSVSGEAGTVIPAGSKVIDKDGGLWTIPADTEIAIGTTATAVKDDPGAYNLIPGSIATIYTPVIGWTGVSNVTLGSVGRDTETDDALRVRIRIQLVSKAPTLGPAIESEIAKVEDVLEVAVFENNTDLTDERGITAHSICCVVRDGDQDDISAAIYGAKAPGIGTYGTSSGTVIDSYGQSKTVYFQRPNIRNAEVIVAGNVYDARVDIDALREQIREAIYEYINGSLSIGEDLVVNRLFAAIYSSIQVSGVAITSVSVTVGQTTGATGIVTADWKDRFNVVSLTDIDASGVTFA